MLLAMFTWCCASFRSFFAVDLKKQGWHRQSGCGCRCLSRPHWSI